MVESKYIDMRFILATSIIFEHVFAYESLRFLTAGTGLLAQTLSVQFSFMITANIGV